ncbi:MAG TPA: hypothetical protein VF761_05305 [Gemmatimonadaceae bacterium]
MPSDERTLRVLEMLAGRVAPFRAALDAAREEIAAYLAAHRVRRSGPGESAAAALGGFALGRIDADRFATVLEDRQILSQEGEGRLEECLTVLDELRAKGDALFVCDVPRGGDLGHAVDRALAEAGRAFGAARVFLATKAGSYRAEDHHPLLRVFPFAAWSRAERELAPPLVIEVDGTDLHPEQLTDFLDGDVHFVFVVRGAASPAPLLRLVSPGTLLVQAHEPARLAVLAGYIGPAVAALLPSTSAELVHDPRAGARLEHRLSIASIPTEGPHHALGSRSVRQLAEELAQLRALDQVTKTAREVSLVLVPPGTPSGTDGRATVDAVASWMLAQAGFAGSVT